MNCPVCDSFDSLKVKDTVKRTESKDYRNIICTQCGAELISSTQLIKIKYKGDNIRLENAGEIINRLKKEYIRYIQQKITGERMQEELF